MKIFTKKFTALFLAAALLLPGCATGVPVTETTKEPLPEVPQTNESLSMYVGFFDTIMEFALPIYQEKYPDVEVEITKPTPGTSASIAEEEEQNDLLVSVMAGNGPDIILTDRFYGDMSVEKIALSGIAADMSEYYNNDAEFALTLNKKIMDSGVIDGKRCFFPISYSLPLLLSTQKTLDKFGISEEKCSDYISFFNKTGEILDSGTKLMPVFYQYENLLHQIGGKYINEESGMVNTELPELKLAFEWLKKLTNLFPQGEKGLVNGQEMLDVRDGEVVFLADQVSGTADYDDYAYYCEILSSLGETPALLPLRNSKGGLTATITNSAFVRANSPNKENAYNFIKVILSPEVQSHYSVRNGQANSVSNISMDEYHLTIKNGLYETTQLHGNNHIRMTEEQHKAYMAYTDEITDTMFHYRKNDIYREMTKDIYAGKTFEESMARIKEDFEFDMSE